MNDLSSKVLIKRELRGSGYRWEMRGKKLIVIDTKTQTRIVLTKVGAMSLVKFIPNYLDKMRIEETRILREKARAIREAKKLKKQQSLLAKTKIR